MEMLPDHTHKNKNGKDSISWKDIQGCGDFHNKTANQIKSKYYTILKASQNGYEKQITKTHEPQPINFWTKEEVILWLNFVLLWNGLFVFLLCVLLFWLTFCFLSFFLTI